MWYGWGEGDDQLWRSECGGIAIVMCYGGGRRATANFGGVDVVPLQGAILECYGWGGGDDGQFWRSGRGYCWVPLLGAIVVRYGGGMPLLCVIVGCHCSVLWLGGKVTTKFGGVDVMPLLGAIAVYQSLFYMFFSIFRATNFIQTPKKTAMDFVFSFLQTLHCSLY